MKKYQVLIEGRNCLVKTVGDQERKMGCFSARGIEASNMEQAERLVIDAIQKELESVIVNNQHDPPMVEIAEINETDLATLSSLPREGFTWYIEDE